MYDVFLLEYPVCANSSMQKGQSSINAIHTVCGVHPTRLLRFIANAYYYYYYYH